VRALWVAEKDVLPVTLVLPLKENTTRGRLRGAVKRTTKMGSREDEGSEWPKKKVLQGWRGWQELRRLGVQGVGPEGWKGFQAFWPVWDLVAAWKATSQGHTDP